MENIRDFMSGILFSVLLSCVFLLTLVLFSLDQSTENDIILLNCMSLFHFNTICYIYCYFSETITANSFKIGDYAYDLLWYKMWLKQQKAIMMIIGRSQKRFRLTGLGLIDCSMETFLTVFTFQLYNFDNYYLRIIIQL